MMSRLVRILCMGWTLTVLSVPAFAQTFTTLHTFAASSGLSPTGGVAQGSNGNFFGMSSDAFFETTAGGTVTVLHHICQTTCADGANAIGGLILGADGDFYGVTEAGGAIKGLDTNYGTAFRLTSNGVLTTLATFDAPVTGANPVAALISGANGDFYGTTRQDGTTSKGGQGGGTVFKLSPSGALTTLYTFCSEGPGYSPGYLQGIYNCWDGVRPESAVVQAGNGNIYGTTLAGGTGGLSGPCEYAPYLGCGTIFELSPSGKLTTLHNFQGGTDGAYPNGVIQGSDGNLYGTTGTGTVFKVTTAGVFTTLYAFDETPPSLSIPTPGATLVEGSDGKFYGTTIEGTTFDSGTIFSITSNGELRTLHRFGSAGDLGVNPVGNLIQGTDGTFYGTTTGDTLADAGTVFSLSVGLRPFVKTETTSGKVGSAVTILGTDLAHTTSVTFNGTSAEFKIVSSSELATSVPKAATTGKVEVKTPSGVISSNLPFEVL